MLAIRFIGGPLDGVEVPPEGGIPKAMPWAILYPCGCVEFVDDVTEVGTHGGKHPQAYYPLDEESTTDWLAVYVLPALIDGPGELPRELDVPEPLVTA
jgi:hypothetical protein